MADFFETLAKIQQQYPAALNLLQQPGVFKLYEQAINEGWSAERVNAGLEATEWWRTTPAPKRQWQALQITDPATATTKIETTKRIVDDLQRQLGVQISTEGGLNSLGFKFLADAVAYGWDPQEIKYRLLASVHGKAAGGELGKTASDVRNMADEYGVPLSDQSVMDYARKIGEGAVDQNGVQGYLIEQAKSLFPTLSAALDKGITVKQYMAPMLQIAQQELNVNPSEISLTDGKWLKLINTTDPKTGERRPMNLDEALTMFRTDSAFGYDKTDKAAQDATQLASVLQQKLGAAG